MEFQTNISDISDSSDLPDKNNTYSFTLSASGTFVGATVSAIVFTTLTTTGEIAASATGTGIELTGNLLAYTTELAVGSFAATTIRSMAQTYSAVAQPTIRNTSRLGALGISVLAGTGAAFTTNAILYGGKKVGSYLYSCYEDYKQKVANNIQYPIESSSEILAIDDIQLIEDFEKSDNLGSKHSLQDD